MSDPSTTIRVQRGTRDLLREAAAAQGTTFDEVIRHALEAYRWQRLREQAAREATALRGDPRERRLAAEVEEDLRDLSAW